MMSVSGKSTQLVHAEGFELNPSWSNSHLIPSDLNCLPLQLGNLGLPSWITITALIPFHECSELKKYSVHVGV